MTKSRIVCEKTLFGVLERHYKVCFSLPMILPICLPILYICASFFDSEPLHFSLESVEFFHASLYRWSLKNKLTLDLFRFIWKSLGRDTRCCNFFPHC